MQVNVAYFISANALAQRVDSIADDFGVPASFRAADCSGKLVLIDKASYCNAGKRAKYSRVVIDR